MFQNQDTVSVLLLALHFPTTKKKTGEIICRQYSLDFSWGHGFFRRLLKMLLLITCLNWSWMFLTLGDLRLQMLRSARLLHISPRISVRDSLCSHHVFVIVLLRIKIRENCSHSAGQSLASKPLRVSNKDQIISLWRNGKKKQWQAVNRGKNRGVISRQFRRLNISVSDNFCGGRRMAGCVCVISERDWGRLRVLKLTGLAFLRSHSASKR